MKHAATVAKGQEWYGAKACPHAMAFDSTRRRKNSLENRKPIIAML